MLVTQISEELVVVNRATGRESEQEVIEAVQSEYPEYGGKVVVQTKKPHPDYPKTYVVQRKYPIRWLMTRISKNQMSINRVTAKDSVQEIVKNVQEEYPDFIGTLYLIPKRPTKESVREVELHQDGTYVELESKQNNRL